MAASPKPVRRIVTGHSSDNTAVVISDTIHDNIRPGSSPGQFSTLMWCTDRMPVDISIGLDGEDMGARKLGTYPPESGSRFIVSEYPPGYHPVMHRTETLDYIIVLSGQISMELDNGEIVSMKAGDVMIQRGTNHAWINKSNDVCRMAFILLDAEPLGIGKPLLRGQTLASHSGKPG